MAVTVLRARFEKPQPRVLNYRGYKYFENSKFRIDLLPGLGKVNMEKMGTV